jgi:hypothetical protein
MLPENNFVLHQMLEKEMGVQWDLTLTDFKKLFDSVRIDVLYNILTESDIPMKLIRLIKCFITQNNTENLLDSSKKVGLEVNEEKQKYYHTSHTKCRTKL